MTPVWFLFVDHRDAQMLQPAAGLIEGPLRLDVVTDGSTGPSPSGLAGARRNEADALHHDGPFSVAVPRARGPAQMMLPEVGHFPGEHGQDKPVIVRRERGGIESDLVSDARSVTGDEPPAGELARGAARSAYGDETFGQEPGEQEDVEESKRNHQAVIEFRRWLGERLRSNSCVVRCTSRIVIPAICDVDLDYVGNAKAARPHDERAGPIIALGRVLLVHCCIPFVDHSWEAGHTKELLKSGLTPANEKNRPP